MSAFWTHIPPDRIRKIQERCSAIVIAENIPCNRELQLGITYEESASGNPVDAAFEFEQEQMPRHQCSAAKNSPRPVSVPRGTNTRRNRLAPQTVSWFKNRYKFSDYFYFIRTVGRYFNRLEVWIYWQQLNGGMLPFTSFFLKSSIWRG